MNWLLSGMAALGISYLVIVAGMYTFQRSFLYLPDKQHFSPDEAGLSGIKALTITTSDGEHLQAWYLPATAGQPTILYLHGNAGSIVGRTERLRFYQRQGVGALFVSYRGYGSSSGSPNQSGLINDALAAYDWLVQENIAAEKIAVLGESLGSGVAVQLALQRPLRAVILEAPFTSTMAVAKVIYWWLPIDLLMKDRFESIAVIDKVAAPILIVHGAEDEITDVEQGKQLFDKAAQPKSLEIIKGASHEGISFEDTWRKELAFIESVKP